MSLVAARRAVVALSGLASALWLLLVDAGPQGHADHFTYRRTVAYMQDGRGYYDAMQQAFADIDTTLGHARAYRMPTAFWIWRWIPEDLLYVAFLAVVVVGTTALLVRLTEHPWAVLPVPLYLLHAGRLEGGGVTELWLLVEFWSVPALVAGVLAWERGRDGLSAGCFLFAALLREVSVPILGMGLVLAHLRGRDRRPWLASLLAFAVAFGVHLTVAGNRIEPPGNDAVLWGTGDPPGTIVHLATYLLPGPAVLWLAAWVLAIWQAHRRDLLLLLAPVLGLPALGLFVDRPYWGLVVVPFVLWLAGEAVAERLSAERRRGAAAEGSSPPPGTPLPGPGTPAAAGAPPSA